MKYLLRPVRVVVTFVQLVIAFAMMSWAILCGHCDKDPVVQDMDIQI